MPDETLDSFDKRFGIGGPAPAGPVAPAAPAQPEPPAAAVQPEKPVEAAASAAPQGTKPPEDLAAFDQRFGIGKSGTPVAPVVAPEPPPAQAAPAPQPAPQPERQPAAMGGYRETPPAPPPAGGLPEFLAPGGESTAFRLAKNIPEITRGILEPLVGGVEIVVQGLENLLSIPERLIKHGDVTSGPKSWWGIADKVKQAGDAFLKGSQLGLPMGDPEKDKYITMPGKLIGGIASFAVPMRWLGFATPGANILTKLASNLVVFSAVDAATATSRGQDPMAAAQGSIPTAVLFSVAQSLPFGKLVSNPYLVRQLEALAGGGAFAGVSAMGGERDPVALAVDFGVGYGTHMFGTRGQPQQELMRRYVDDFKKRHGLDDAGFREVMDVLTGKFKHPTEDANAPAPDPQVAAKVQADLQTLAEKYGPALSATFGKPTEGTGPLDAEQKRDAIFGGQLGQIIEDANTRALAVQRLGLEGGMDPKKAERFYDLYKKGDQETAFKEFPEFASGASPSQARASTSLLKPTVDLSKVTGPMTGAGYDSLHVGREEAPESIFKDPTRIPGPITESLTKQMPVKDFRKLANRVQEAGDPAAAERLDEILANNQETLGNLFRVPREQRKGLKEIADRVVGLVDRIERDGDPDAARKLSDLISTNQKTLRGVLRWEVEEQATAIPDAPVGTSAGQAQDLATAKPIEEVAKPPIIEKPIEEPAPEVEPPVGGPGEAVGKAAGAAKEPWEMTKEKFQKSKIGQTYTDSMGREQEVSGKDHELRVQGYQHQAIIEQALQEGKPVPPEVLADYPDLAAKYGKAAPSDAATKVQQPASENVPAAGGGVVYQEPDGWWVVRGHEDRIAFASKAEAEQAVGKISEMGVDVEASGKRIQLHAEIKKEEAKLNTLYKKMGPMVPPPIRAEVIGRAEKKIQGLYEELKALETKQPAPAEPATGKGGEGTPKYSVKEGEPGGERLFQTAEGSKEGEQTWGKADIQKMYGPKVKVTESTVFPGFFEAEFPSGIKGKIEKDGSISVNLADLQTGHGLKQLGPDQYIAGEFYKIDQGMMIRLASGEDLDTLYHEGIGHPVYELFATDRERTAMLRDKAPEIKAATDRWQQEHPGETLTPEQREGIGKEVIADALAKAHLEGGGVQGSIERTIIQRIKDFFTGILDKIYPTWNSVVRSMRSGEMFGRTPEGWAKEEGGLPEALAPSQYSVKEGEPKEESKLSQFKNWWMRGLASSRTSAEATRTHQVIAASQSEAATEITRMKNIFDAYINAVGPIGEEATQKFLRVFEDRNRSESQIRAEIDHMVESGQLPPDFRLLGILYREEERRQMDAMKALGKAPQEIANYVDHLWKPNEAREKLKRDLAAYHAGERSMRGDDYFMKLRTVMSIPEGMAAGLIPAYDTLPEMMLAGRTAREFYMAAQKRLNFIKANGYDKVVKALDDGKWVGEGEEKHWESAVPDGWKVYPGGYGEVWTKIRRRAGQMIPGVADENAEPLGGGEGRHGYEDVPKIDAWSRVGYRVGPEEVVRQFEDFLGRGLSGNTAFEGYQAGLHAVRHMQMALSMFHAFATTINSMATRAGGALFDIGGAFTGDWRRSAEGFYELATTPLAVYKDIKFARELDKALMSPDKADLETLAIARSLVSGGMRTPGTAEGGLAKILSHNFVDFWNERGIGAKASALVKGSSAPTMEFIVPFAKNGSTAFNYLREVRNFERENGRPPTLEEKQNLAYESRDTADSFFGQMARDNVGMSAMVKSLLTGVLQFFTWQFGTVRGVSRTLSGLRDIVGKGWDVTRGEEVRKLSIKDRQSIQYVAGMLFTVGLIGGLMHYAFTGQKPEKAEDFFFPATGEVKPNGSLERLQLPSYLKDFMGFSKHPGSTIAAKLASPIHILSDLYQNRNYWGNQIWDPHDWAGQKGLDVLKYAGEQTLPFIYQTYKQGSQQTAGRAGLSWFGVRPVNRETANTPMANVIDEYNQIMRASTTTKESAELKTLKADLMKMARGQDIAGFEAAAKDAVEKGKLTRAQIKDIEEESQVPPGVSRFYRLPVEWMVRALKAADPKELDRLTPYMLKKISFAKPEILIHNRDTLVPLLKNLGFQQVADTIENLTLPEQATEFDLTGLGIVQPGPQIGGMNEVDQAVADAIQKQTEKLGMPAKAKGTRLTSLSRTGGSDKKNVFGILGF